MKNMVSLFFQFSQGVYAFRGYFIFSSEDNPIKGEVMPAARHGFEISEINIDLVTYLNDGVRPEIKTGSEETTYLVVEVNGPREITSKVMTLAEINAELSVKTVQDLIHNML